MAESYEEKSYWLKAYGPYEPDPPLEGEIQADVAVIGGGFTGLSTAHNLLLDEPTLRVAVLESKVVGYGASGRNAGFSMTLFGLEPSVTKMLFGQQRTVDAHHYMERAVDYVQELVEVYDLDSDYEHPGFFRVATTPRFAKRIQHGMEILMEMGIGGLEWWEAEQVRDQVDSPLFLGACWEPRSGLLDPAKHVRELKRIAKEAGAIIYEETPVLEVKRGEKFMLTTPVGKVMTDKVVFATNAWSHLIPQLRRKQAPAFTHMVVTEPLNEEQLDTIGWRNRQGIEDARNLMHYFRLTSDNRVAMGGRDVSIAYGRDMDRDLNQKVFRDLERDVIQLFPGLKGVQFVDRWGGPVSVPVDMVPAIGFVGDQRAVYSLGYLGHGVSMAQLNGRTIADLLLEKDTDLTQVWFVGRRTLPWPPEPVRFVVSQVIRGYLRVEDAIMERGMSKTY